MDIQTSNTFNANYVHLDALMRTEYPDDFYGLSGNGQLHLADGTAQPIIDDCISMANAHDTLIVAIDPAIIAGDSSEEAIITCVALPTVFDYKIWEGITLRKSGSVDDGNIEYRTNMPGKLTIEITRPGTYETGHAQLEVV